MQGVEFSMEAAVSRWQMLVHAMPQQEIRSRRVQEHVANLDLARFPVPVQAVQG